MVINWVVCTECGGDKEADVMCECMEYAAPVSASKYAFTVSCGECGESGSVEHVQLHSCDIAKNGGRCEDFPCCGHPVNEGCQMQREFTSDYWLEMYSRHPELMED